MLGIKTLLVAVALAASTGLSASALAQDTSSERFAAGVIVLPFTISGHADGTSLPPRACTAPQSVTPTEAGLLDAAANSDLPAELTAALVRELAAHKLQVYPEGQSAPPAALIVAGCIERADPGDPVQRLIGMNLGASVLAAHVQLYRAGPAQPQLVGEFDVEARGANKLPPIGPIGLAVHGVKDLHETLSADADKLARMIAERTVAG